jgi:hypothetical protein
MANNEYFIICSVENDKPYVGTNNLGEVVQLWIDPISAYGFIDYVQYPDKWYVREASILLGKAIAEDEA